MTTDREENSLFVLTEEKRQLEKYDLISKKRLAVLDLDTAGFNLVIMGEE